MADSPDSILDSVLHGNLTNVPEPPPRVVKLMIVSTKSDFEMERRHLHESVWPELQRECASSGVDLEILDVQQGRDLDCTYDPHAFGQQLKELENCHQESLGCFLLCLIGNKYKPCPLPRCIEVTDYEPIYEKAQEAGLDVSLLSQWYTLDNNTVPATYVVKQLDPKLSRHLIRPTDITKEVYDLRVLEWIDEAEEVLKIIQYGARVAHQEGLINQNKDTRQKRFFMSGVHSQLDYALRLSSTAHQRIMCVIRQIEGEKSASGQGTSCHDDVFYSEMTTASKEQ